MIDQRKTKQQLIEELQGLRRRVTELEAKTRAGTSKVSSGKESKLTSHLKDAAIERAEHGIGFCDLEGNLIYVNNALVILCGYENEEELLGFPVTHFAVDENQVWKMVRELQIKGKWYGELAGRRKDGLQFHVQVSASMIMDDEGTPLCMMGSFMDITARKEAENALAESEENYRRLFETTLDGVVISGPDGRILKANSAAARMVGFNTPDECVGLRMADYYADPSQREELIAELMKKGSLKDVDITFKRTDGTTGTGKVSLTLHKDREGGVKQIDGIVRDVTEEKRREKELEESKEKYAALVNNIQDGIYTVDEKGYFTYVNQVIEDRAGISQEQFRKLRFNDLIKPEYHDTVWANFERVMRGEKVAPYELEYLSADGRTLEAEVHTWPAVKNGRIIGVQGISRDISPRRQLIESLQASERQYRSLVEGSLQGLVILSSHEQRIVFANAAAEQILRHSSHELKTWTIDNLLNLIHPQDRPAITLELQNVLQGRGSGKPFEFRLLLADQTVSWITTFTNSVEFKGQPALQVAILDMTERRLAEQSLRESEENFRAIADNASDGILIAVGKGTHVYANRRASEIMGYSIGELLQATIEDLADPSETEKLMEMFPRRLSGDLAVSQHETAIRHKDGRSIPIELTGSRTHWRGQPADIVIIRDISARKKVEKELLESEQKYRNLVERANDGIAIFQDNVLKFANQRMFGMIGYKNGEGIGLDLSSFVTDDQIKKISDRYRRRIAGEEVEAVYETAIKHKDGHRIEVELNAGLAMLEERPADFVIVRDVTERKKVEEALRHSEARMRAILDAIPDLMIGLNSDGTIVDYHAGRENAFAVESGAVIGRRISDLLPQEIAAPIMSHLSEAFQADRLLVYEYEIPIPLPDGERRHFEARSIASGQDELLVIIRDITDRKRSEQALRESEEKYRGLVEQSLVGVGMSCGNDVILANQALLDILGYDNFEEMARIPLLDHIAPSSRDHVLSRMMVLSQGEDMPSDTDYDVLRKDGQIRRVHAFSNHLSIGGEVLTQTVFLDVTERRKQERALRESEEKFRALAEQSPNLIFINKGGQVVYTNRKCQEVMGYTSDEFASPQFDFMAMIAPESVEKTRHEYARHLEREPVAAYDCVLLTKDGRRIDAYLDTKWIQFQEGEAILGTITDITERKKMEALLRESEGRYRTMFENMVVGLYRTTQDGRILAANPALLGMLGFSSFAELAQRNLETSYFEPQYPRLDFKQRIERDGEVVGMESIWIMKDGRALDVRESARAVRNDAGNVKYYEGSVEDITARKQAEERLRQSEARYRAVVQDQTELICRFNAERVLTFVNDAYCRYFGKKSVQLIGQTFMPLISDEDREAIARCISSISWEHPLQTVEERVIMPTGETRWMQWTNRGIFDESGRIVEYQAVGSDITDIKRANELLRNSLKEKDVLLQELHHRVKNNLQVVSSLLDLQAKGLKDEAGRLALKECQTRVQSIARVHDRLYRSEDLANVDFGKFIRDLVRDLLNASAVDPENVTLQLHVDDIELSLDAAVPSAMILNELLSNTFKYAFPLDRKGAVRVSFRMQGSGDMELLVSDDGPGFPQQIDFRNMQTLGMQLVMALVDQLYGKIELDRRGGATFRITFPQQGQ